MEYCRVDDCICIARSDGYCRGHLERLRKGGDARKPLRKPLGTWGAVTHAALDYQSVPSGPEHDGAFRAATSRFRRAVIEYADRVRSRRRAR